MFDIAKAINSRAQRANDLGTSQQTSKPTPRPSASLHPGKAQAVGHLLVLLEHAAPLRPRAALGALLGPPKTPRQEAQTAVLADQLVLEAEIRERAARVALATGTVSYTHLTLPTIYSV